MESTGPEPGAARKVVTAVFGDLVGSTALQETLDPETARQVMSRFYEAMRGVIARHGGRLDKFVGDGVVAVFGVPLVAEDDALRAVRCALAMLSELATLDDELDRGWGVRLRMRVGVNTGELVISGDGELVGDAMNTAARLEQAAAPGEVLVGEQTWRLTRHAVPLASLPPLTLKGKSGPVQAWRLVATEPGAEEPATRAEAPLVGRAGELERLHAVLGEACVARGCRLVTVIGSPGMGKTRLAEEFALAVRERAAVVRGRCEASGEGVTFGPVAELLRAAADIGETDPPDMVRAKLGALVTGEPDAERTVARAGSLLGVADPASVQETFWGVRRVLEALARRRPLVVLLEDLHWGQPLLLDLVQHLAEWVRDAPMLLLALSRPELRETRELLTVPARPVSEVLELSPLASGESRAFVEGLLGQAALPTNLLSRILDTTEGNPLFLGETLRMLVDDGTLTKQGDTWVTAESATVAVPPTIHALLAARLERLRHDERAVVERAAVIGKQFYRGAVAELVSPAVRSGLDGHLETLRRKEMVEPDGTYWVDEPVYRFHHVLIRDAAYRSLLKEARAELHERFADWLATKAGDLVGEHEEVIAFHLEQAHEYRRQLGPLDASAHALAARAAAMLASAGRRALARADLSAAANLLGRAAEPTEVDDPELLWDWAETLLSAGDATGANAVVERLRRLPEQRHRAAVLAGQLAILTGNTDLAKTIEQVSDAARDLAAAGDGSGAAKAHHVTAQAHAQLGQLGGAEAALDRALLAARKAGDRRRITAVLAAAPRAALWGPSPVVRASGRCLDVLRILRMTPGSRHVEAIALRCQAVLEASRGRFDPARAILDSARTTLTELGLTLELHELAGHAGIVELLAGDPAAAEAALRPARDGFTALGAEVAAAQAAALLARALVDQGRHEEAIEQTRYAEDHAGGDLKTTITWCGARAEALAHTGSPDEALALARRAVELAEPTDALTDKADATLTLARVLRTLGRADEARAAAHQARELYQTKDHAVGIARATERAGAPVAPRQEPPQPSAVLGDRPPERVWAQVCRHFGERDIERQMALYTDDHVLVDHRTLGWEETGKDGVRAASESLQGSAPDIRVETNEVLACDERVIALRAIVKGTTIDGGGEFEIAFGQVSVIENGLILRTDRYDTGDRRAMIARYAELGGGQGLLGDRPSERVLREMMRRFAVGDIDDLFMLYADDLVMIDHRKLSWVETDKQGQRRVIESMCAAALDVRAEIDEVLACDDRVVVTVQVFRGHASDGRGAFEIPYGIVMVIEDGLLRRTERYEPEDREAMLARYAELGGRPEVLAQRPPEKCVAELFRRLIARDVDRILQLYRDDYVRVDHRGLGWEETGKDGVRSLHGSLIGAAADLRVVVDEVLACDDRVIAFSYTIKGTNTDGGGPAEIAMANLLVVEDGLIVRSEHYEHGDRHAVITRYAELGGGLAPLGDRPPELVYREAFVRFTRGDFNGVFDLYADDLVMVEHRALGWSETDKQRVRDVLESMLATTRDARYEVDEVLACDDRIIAFSCACRGTHIDGGGTFEIAHGVASVVEGGLVRRLERYEPEDRAGMLARYAELGGRREVLGDRPPEQLIAEWCRRFNAHDLDGAVALCADDYGWVDHRKLGWEEIGAYDGARANLASLSAAAPDMRGEVDEVLACDDRVIAFRFTFRGTSVDGGGPAEIPVGLVDLIEDGRIARSDLYHPDDRQEMIARYAELGGGLAALGDRPPEQLLKETCRRFARGDVDGFIGFCADDFVMVDHRKLGWSETDEQGYRGIVESMLAASLDVRIEIDEVLACDDRVIACCYAWRGHAVDGGGAFEIAGASVTVFEDGLARRVERFDPEDRAGVLARYAELAGKPATLLGDRPPERVVAEYRRRWAEHDVDGLVALYADDHVRVDHRTLGWEEIRGENTRQLLESFHTAAPDMRLDVDEVLACDDRVIAFSATAHGTSVDGGGAFEIAFGWVAMVEKDLLCRVESYEPDDRQAMLARYVELGGGHGALGDRPSERVYRDLLCRWARRDLDGFLELLADDFVTVDHRKLGWTQYDKRSYRDLSESLWAASLDVRGDVDEVVACDDRVIAMVGAFRGHSADGGGEFEIANGIVVEVEDGRVRRSERYEYDDREAMLARFAELGGRSAVLGDRPPERVVSRLCRRWTAADIDTSIGLFTDDVERVDHRTLGYDEAHGSDGLRETYAAMLGVSSAVHIDPEEVLACDDRVLVLLATLRGTAAEGGGEYATPCGYLFVVAGDRVQRLEQFEPDDRQAMLVRYTELGGGLGPLGDRPPERSVARSLRCMASRDVDGLMDLHADDYQRIDHRALGWGETTKDRQMFESFFAAASDLWWQFDEVLACDDRVIAGTCTLHGCSNDGGGRFEMPFGVVLVVENGLRTREHLYEPDDRQAMLARYVELGGGQGSLGDRPPERWAARFVRLWASRDIEGLMDLHGDDYRRIDHRTLGWGEITKAELRELFESFFAAASDIWGQVNEVVACDDRVIAATWTIHGHGTDGGGAFEIPFGLVQVIENGQIQSVDQYDPGDQRAMIARYAELGGGQGPLGNRPPERYMRQFCRRFATGDLDTLMELYTDDYVVVDHRTPGRDGTDKADQRALYESYFATGTDLWAEIGEVLACDDRVIALTLIMHGRDQAGGGTFEIPAGVVVVVENGHGIHDDIYAPEDRDAMLAGFAELSREP